MGVSPKEAKLLAYFNGTIPLGVYPNCTLHVNCLLTGFSPAQINYYPSLDGNLFYLALFALFLIVHIGQGIAWKTWSYSLAIIFGLVLECVGYMGRIALNRNPFIFNSFLVYLICLTIAPIFFTACIYLCLSRLIPLYDPMHTLSRFAPKTYTYLFLGADFFSLVLQAIGGALSAEASTLGEEWTGIHVMVAGLGFQVLSLAIFSLLCAEFAFRVYRSNAQRRGGGGRMHAFELALIAATLFVVVRSIYRCAEMAGGFKGALANEEVPFMILEGAMVVLACLCLTVLHPGWVLKGAWGWTAGGDGYIEGSELIGMGIGGKTEGFAEGSSRYINIDNDGRGI